VAMEGYNGDATRAGSGLTFRHGLSPAPNPVYDLSSCAPELIFELHRSSFGYLRSASQGGGRV
jgi:hypothetical protein